MKTFQEYSVFEQRYFLEKLPAPRRAVRQPGLRWTGGGPASRPPYPYYTQLTELLISALATMHGEVKLIEHRKAQRVTQLIPAHHAAALVERYSHDTWQFRLRKCGRVKWIRRMVASEPRWVRCYRTAEAPVLPPSIEWLNSRLGL